MKRVALKTYKMSTDELITFTRGVRNAMTAAADVFASPLVPLATLGNDLTALQDAQQDTLLGGKAATIHRDEVRKKVERHLRKLANYVEAIADGDPDIITMAGMSPRTQGPRRYESLAAPQNLRLRNLLSGEVGLTWNKVAYARSYAIEYSTEPLAADSWKQAGFNSNRSASVSRLQPMTRYWFRVCALGTESLVSNWSEPVMIAVV